MMTQLAFSVSPTSSNPAAVPNNARASGENPFSSLLSSFRGGSAAPNQSANSQPDGAQPQIEGVGVGKSELLNDVAALALQAQEAFAGASSPQEQVAIFTDFAEALTQRLATFFAGGNGTTSSSLEPSFAAPNFIGIETQALLAGPAELARAVMENLGFDTEANILGDRFVSAAARLSDASPLSEASPVAEIAVQDAVRPILEALKATPFASETLSQAPAQVGIVQSSKGLVPGSVESVPGNLATTQLTSGVPAARVAQVEGLPGSPGMPQGIGRPALDGVVSGGQVSQEAPLEPVLASSAAALGAGRPAPDAVRGQRLAVSAPPIFSSRLETAEPRAAQREMPGFVSLGDAEVKASNALFAPQKEAGALGSISGLAPRSMAETAGLLATLSEAGGASSALSSRATLSGLDATSFNVRVGAEQQAAPAFVRHLAAQVSGARITEGTTRIELTPRGLGDIEIDMRHDEAGKLRIVLKAESPVVLNAFRQDREILLNALRDGPVAGTETDLSFESFEGHQSRQHSEQERWHSAFAGDGAVVAGPEAPSTDLLASTPATSPASSGLDIIT